MLPGPHQALCPQKLFAIQPRPPPVCVCMCVWVFLGVKFKNLCILSPECTPLAFDSLSLSLVEQAGLKISIFPASVSQVQVFQAGTIMLACLFWDMVSCSLSWTPNPPAYIQLIFNSLQNPPLSALSPSLSSIDLVTSTSFCKIARADRPRCLSCSRVAFFRGLFGSGFLYSQLYIIVLAWMTWPPQVSDIWILGPQLRVVWRGLGHVALLKEVCYWGLDLRFQKTHAFLN